MRKHSANQGKAEDKINLPFEETVNIIARIFCDGEKYSFKQIMTRDFNIPIARIKRFLRMLKTDLINSHFKDKMRVDIVNFYLDEIRETFKAIHGRGLFKMDVKTILQSPSMSDEKGSMQETICQSAQDKPSH